MKSLLKILVALYISALGFGCNNNNEEPTGGEGADNPVETTAKSQEETKEIKEEVAKEYNNAQEFNVVVSIDNAEAEAQTEELLVVLQSSKAGDESIVLVAEKSSSETTVRTWLGKVNNSISELQQNFCNKEVMVSGYDKLTASVAVVGTSVEVLTGGIECSVDAEAECGSHVQGMMVTGLSKNEAGAISGVTLGKEGAVVQLSLENGKESELDLAVYTKFLSDIKSESFCSELAKQEAVATTEATPAAGATTTPPAAQEGAAGAATPAAGTTTPPAAQEGAAPQQPATPAGGATPPAGGGAPADDGGAGSGN